MLDHVRLVRTTAMMMALAFVVGCQAGGGSEAADGPRLVSTADTIAYGRTVVLHHGCGDCHGGVDNPGAPNWLVGFRSASDDTLFWPAVMPTPMGTFRTWPRNITPDNETGIGRFSERQIFNALRYGLRPGETPEVVITSTTPGEGNFPANPKYLAPPMPWPAFRHMSDTDLWAIAAYLKRGVAPQTNRVEPSEGPPDFWAGIYSMMAGPATPPAFPTAREVALPPG